MSKSLDELDRLAAEKVMCWNIVNQAIVDANDKYLYDLDEWQPTRNIAQAWEVIEKLQPFAFGLLYEKLDLQWYCEIEYPKLKVSSTEAETAPLAICMAALKAKELL